MKASEIAELKKIHKYNVILGSLLAVLKQYFPGVWLRAVSGQAWTREKVLSSLHFILSNHLSAVNKQGVDPSSKAYLKDTYKYEHCCFYYKIYKTGLKYFY